MLYSLAIHLRCTNGNISPGKIYFANGPTLYSLAIHLRCTAATSHKLDDFYNVAEAIGHASGLTVSYKGYRVQNIYQEGDYFAVTPEDGNKLVVMKFEIKNKGKKKVRLDTEKLGITFYACFDGKNRIKETASLGTRSLSSYGETIRGGKKKTAVLLFQIPKDQADKISGETLYAEIKDTIYSLKYK